MARRGVNVVLAARRREQLERVAAECAALGVTARAIPTDVSRREECRRLIDGAGQVDILINNAGFGIFDTVAEAKIEDWQEMMATNFFGAVHTTQAVLPQMLARGDGSIVNVSSIAGLMGYERMTGYCASKFALTGFTEGLRDEVLAKGVRVALVCPGTTDTEFFVRAEKKKIPAASRLALAVSPARVARVICNAAESGRYRKIMPLMASTLIRLKELTPRTAHALIRSVSRVLESR